MPTLTDDQVDAIRDLLIMGNKMFEKDPFTYVLLLPQESFSFAIRDGNLSYDMSSGPGIDTQLKTTFNGIDDKDIDIIRIEMDNLLKEPSNSLMPQLLKSLDGSFGMEINSLERQILKQQMADAFVKEYKANGYDAQAAIDAVKNNYEFTNAGFVEETVLVNQCFPAHTKIQLSDGTEKPIADITTSDEVAAFHPSQFAGRGGLQSQQVVRLFENITDVWVQLSNGTTVTPGHHFLDAKGGFRTIADILVSNNMNEVLFLEAG
jgi:hypothetical protein